MSFSPLCQRLLNRNAYFKTILQRQQITDTLAELAKKIEEAKMNPNEEDPALKLIVQSKVVASDIMQDLDALDSFTEDWPAKGNLKKTALAVHLRCETASNACQEIKNALDSLTTTESDHNSEEAFMTMGVCVEYAEGKLNQINALLEGVCTAFPGDGGEVLELGVEEMKVRTADIMEKLAGLKSKVNELKEVANGAVLKWRSQTINECIVELQRVVAELAEAAKR